MTPILFSLVALTVTFAALVLWAFSDKTRQRWEQASQLPFDEAAPGGSQDD